MPLTPTVAAVAVDGPALTAATPSVAARAVARPVVAAQMPALDGLRGVAVLAVILFHLWAVPAATGAAWRASGVAASTGWLGVELFFVISGCLITGILLDTRDCVAPLRTFWARRALRILPLYAAFLTVAFVVVPALVPALPRGNPQFIDAAPWYWTFLTNVALARSHGMAAFGTGHLWSVAIEEQFYLLWPLVVLRTSTRTVARAAGALLVLCIVGRAVLRLAGVLDGYSAYVLTPTHVDGLLVGALLAVALRDTALRERVRRLALPVAAGAGALVLAVMLAQRSASAHGLPMQLVGLPLVALAMGGVVARAALARDDRWTRALGGGPLAHVGTYSYALYVLHYPLMTAIGVIGLAPPGLVRKGVAPGTAQLVASALVLVLTYALARASWAVIERPALSLKRLVPYVR